MAKTLSRVTGIEDDTITNAQAMLLAFDQIGKDVFPQALASAADLSVFLGQDLSTSARLLGRALQNPADGVTALGRANVKFSEDQELAIKKMAESGDIAGAQDAILSKVQERLGDVAEMVGNTGTSAWVKFRQAMGNSMELQGKYNTDVLSPFLNLMTGSVNAVNDAREAVDGMVDSLLKGKNIFQTWKEFEKATGASPLAPM
jgi:hypothetical protein